MLQLSRRLRPTTTSSSSSSVSSHLLTAIISTCRTPRRHISAFYVTGDKANQTYVALTPYFDFKSRLGDGAADSPSALAAAARLHANVRARRRSTAGSGAPAAVNVPELLQLWSVFRDVQLRKVALERERVRVAETLKALHNQAKMKKDADEDDIEKTADLQRKLKADGVLLRDDLKRLKENSYALEDTFVHRYLDLPNELHPRTPCDPEDGPTILHSSSRRVEADRTPAAPAGHHLAGTERLIEFRNAFEYYLLDEAAEFELAASAYFADAFCAAGFVRSSAPDFCRSLLAEAAGLDTDRDLLTVEEDGDEVVERADGGKSAKADEIRVDRTHLTGGASLASFLGWCAKLAPFQSALPLRLVGAGRSYAAPQTMATDAAAAADVAGLYGAVQTTAVQCFQAATDATQAERLFDETVALLAEAYAPLGRPMRIVQVPARRLRRAEAMRADVELWSEARAEFVCVGDVRYYGDWLSKRVLFSYKETAAKEKAEKSVAQRPKFAFLVGGTVVDVTRLLAVLLESGGANRAAEFRVPDFMKWQTVQ